MKDEGTTYHQFVQADLAIPRNRFSEVNRTTVIGAGGDYPAAGSHQRDPSPPEEPLGLDNPALEFDPSDLELTSLPAQATGSSVSGDVAPSTTTSPGLMSERRDTELPLSRCYRRF